jgi:hypothetical protein
LKVPVDAGAFTVIGYLYQINRTHLGVTMVKFEDLKTGDIIARRMPKLDGDRLVHYHGVPWTVLGAVTNPCGGTRSVRLGAANERIDYWLHDLQFSTVDDELKRWDKIS